VDKKFISNSA